jgi:Domain of unknown function (DUF4149)
MTARPGVPIAEMLMLSAWIGAALLFSAVVAPAAFAVLPSRALAGALAGRVLPVLFYLGIAVGLAVAALELIARTSAWGRTAAGAVTAFACATAQIVVGGRIERLRAEIGGPLDALAADDPRRLVFGKLHAASVAWLGVALLAAFIALVLAVRAARARP